MLVSRLVISCVDEAIAHFAEEMVFPFLVADRLIAPLCNGVIDLAPPENEENIMPTLPLIYEHGGRHKRVKKALTILASTTRCLTVCCSDRFVLSVYISTPLDVLTY